MALQYQTANGTWIDCGDRTEWFLQGCDEFGGHENRDGVLAALAAGETVRNDRADWYSKCRDGDVCNAQLVPDIHLPANPCESLDY